ncbi:unnamed protein product [Allacma fusca]|uniref:Uncharacterized protein n=1 Tax=Allacma fusca TaxID=39272 RepID=A0A8J2JPL0_9HEXA|nr:unnamed protein product [Allacma fusca]
MTDGYRVAWAISGLLPIIATAIGGLSFTNIAALAEAAPAPDTVAKIKALEEQIHKLDTSEAPKARVVVVLAVSNGMSTVSMDVLLATFGRETVKGGPMNKTSIPKTNKFEVFRIATTMVTEISTTATITTIPLIHTILSQLKL